MKMVVYQQFLSVTFSDFCDFGLVGLTLFYSTLFLIIIKDLKVSIFQS